MKRTINLITITLFLVLIVQTGFPQKQTPPEGGQPKDFTLPQKTTFKLDNGLKVTMVEYGTLPKVSVRLVVRAGNVNEAQDQVWLADLTGDMLKEGTATRSAQDIARQAADMGGTVEVATGSDQSYIGGDVLSEFAPQMVSLIADIVQHPSFPESSLERLKRDYIRRLNISRTQAQSLAMEKFLAALYPDHPYGRAFPSEEMLKSYDLDAVKQFFNKNYGARRAHIFVVGMFDAGKTKKAIQKAFGSWRKGSPPAINIPTPVSRRRTFLIDRPGAPQSTIYMGLPVIDPSKPDYIPLLVTNALLGGSFSSRITSNIREDKGYTYSPHSSVTSHYRTAFWAEMADVTTQFTGASISEILKEINRLRQEPPGADELRAIQNYMAGTFVLRNSSRRGIIGQLAFLDLHGLDDSYLTGYVKHLYSVTPEQVQRMAQNYIRPADMTTVIVGDKKVVRKQVKKFGPIIY